MDAILDTLAAFLPEFDLEVTLEYLPLLLDATLITLYLSVLSGIFGTIIGAACAIIRITPLSFPNRMISVYIWLMRGLPTLIFILFVYYGLPAFGIELDPFPSAVIALSLNAGAFWGEIFRAGIEAVPSGQWDAGRSLGLRFGPLMFKIVLPQAFRIVVPPYLNGLITLAKDTSLVSAITVTELTLTAQRAYASSFRPLEILTVATILYLIMTSTLMVAQYATERRLRLPGSVATFRERRTQGARA